MDFEYTVRMSDGRKLFAVGEAIVLHNCDCCEQGKAHVQFLTIESAMELFDNGDESECLLDYESLGELESRCERKVYRDLEIEREDCGAA